MEKKPVYESPKVSRLDEKEALQGQVPCFPVGSGDLIGCESGNNPGPEGIEMCVIGSAG